MAPRHPQYRRIALAAAGAALIAPLVIGCSAVEKALDCARTATLIAESASDLQQAVQNAGEDPAAAQQALDDIEKNLDELADRSDNADVGKAAGDIRTAVDNVRESIENGDPTPDVTPVLDATGELTKTCQP
ncbi:hypothetical protein [Streptomyces sp. KLOTTS4A1]|uniref:hypothetical protein n=1 Tax=Streptomyces sp. KLOTTS4A1 TaxID=3390996 RepID=UPI0039F47F5F